MKKVLTIAGSDCSGGAGIQADLKTITAHKMYGMSVITALTAQNTTGVYGIMDAGAEFVKNQLDCVFSDIFPDAVKIGMVSNPEIISAIAEKLTEYDAKNVVVDPVMSATSGGALIKDGGANALIERLIPHADIITPNILEAEILSGMKIETKEDMLLAAERIAKFYSGGILIKGGHLADCADDLLFDGETAKWFAAKRIDNPNTHGTGCTLSSAIACALADGASLYDAVKIAKAYVNDAIASMLDLGNGSGPLNHMCRMS